MAEKDLSECRRKYEISRHHAWAGTALLSVLLALRYLVTIIPDGIFILLGSGIILYILAGLAFTFKYGAGLFSRQGAGYRPEESGKEKVMAKAEKGRLKLEKKRVKSEAKAREK
ncbi:MAG TPA: hypothetical protein VMW42_02405 [Desulfatiglandales bacterium]|nr:hypothetical protein [Desulfatiglandales bacterium]